MVNGSKHVRHSLRKTGDGGCLVITAFAKEIAFFLVISNGEKLSLIFRKNNSSLLKHNPIHKNLLKLMLFYNWDH